MLANLRGEVEHLFHLLQRASHAPHNVQLQSTWSAVPTECIGTIQLGPTFLIATIVGGAPAMIVGSLGKPTATMVPPGRNKYGAVS